MGMHIGAQKHANCFNQIFLGLNFVQQSTTLMHNQHVCDVITVMLQ